MKSKQFHFFATKNEIQKTLNEIEEEQKIKYLQFGLLDTPTRTCYLTYSEIPDLGISIDGTYNNQRKYLVTTINNEFDIVLVPQRKGGIKYSASYSNNPSCILFTPSGEYNNYCLIYGNVSGVNNDNETSLSLYKLFFKKFKNGFKSIKSFRVSTEAEILLDRGFKLTSNYRSNPEMDLSK